MKLCPLYFVLTTLSLMPAGFSGEKRGPSIESPKVLQIAATDPDAIIKQIDLKVMLEQYETLMTERIQAQVQLDLAEVGSSSLLTEDEQKKLGRDLDGMASEEQKKATMERYAEQRVNARVRMQKKIAILSERCDQIREKATHIIAELEKVRQETTPCGTEGAKK